MAIFSQKRIHRSNNKNYGASNNNSNCHTNINETAMKTASASAAHKTPKPPFIPSKNAGRGGIYTGRGVVKLTVEQIAIENALRCAQVCLCLCA